MICNTCNRIFICTGTNFNDEFQKIIREHWKDLIPANTKEDRNELNDIMMKARSSLESWYMKNEQRRKLPRNPIRGA